MPVLLIYNPFLPSKTNPASICRISCIVFEGESYLQSIIQFPNPRFYDVCVCECVCEWVESPLKVLQ